MLSDLVNRYEGKAANWLAKRAANGVGVMVDTLFLEAITLWEARAFLRVADDEICCTVPFYDCCEQALESNPDRFAVMRIVYDAAQPTREMRAGLVHPKGASRPDLSIAFGLVTIRIEAKRLALRGGLPKKYVQEGMRRFLDKKYISSHGRAGYMLGFVVRDKSEDVITAIDKVIVAEKDLSASDKLGSITKPLPKLCRCESKHMDDLRLVHSLIDLRRQTLTPAKTP